jgi:hypothetical protein
MQNNSRPLIHVAGKYQPIFRELGIDAESVFDHPLIKVWRTLNDRENCTLDETLRDGRKIHWHIKRYKSSRPMSDEINGHRALVDAQIPTAELVASGKIPDGRSFVIFEDLSDFTAADKLIQNGASFDRLLNPTADLAANLHKAGLHHRDLYLCHFFAKPVNDEMDIRLIDTARVKKLPGIFTRSRWIVKDLAQFWYSTLALKITDDQRAAWLTRYAEQCGLIATAPLRRKIDRKIAWIAKHDAQLRRQQPHRNISIPSGRSSHA